MLSVKLAPAAPFSGAPKINLPTICGASPRKPFLLRIPVIGQRPVRVTVSDLPEGLRLEGNILSGQVGTPGDYEITVRAENALGSAEKTVKLEIAEGNVLVTPLLGFTSWNAFGQHVTQADMLTIAQRMDALGLGEYGYRYINLDSGWQGTYGGPYDAIQPNYKFPDMLAMTRALHEKGYLCGIYSTPMLTAWGCPDEFSSIPGCTTGTPDVRFADTNGGIGVEHKEANNVRQWQDWEFDYLKYDWAPTDPVNADLMRTELAKANRSFGFCVTVRALREFDYYWSKYCNSYRDNVDTQGFWENTLSIYDSYFPHMESVCKGHYFDLDMLDIGTHKPGFMQNLTLTEDEQLVEFSMRAILGSPLQISSMLDAPTAFEINLYSNEEILAIHQDCAFQTARPVLQWQAGAGRLDVIEKPLEDGSYAYGIFNLGQSPVRLHLDFPEKTPLRDVWAKEALGSAAAYRLDTQPHTARILRSNTRLANSACR